MYILSYLEDWGDWRTPGDILYTRTIQLQDRQFVVLPARCIYHYKFYCGSRDRGREKMIWHEVRIVAAFVGGDGFVDELRVQRDCS